MRHVQVGKFVVGQPEGSDVHIHESEVAEGLRFPALFRGEGMRGHRYHVFDGPRYYASWEQAERIHKRAEEQ